MGFKVYQSEWGSLPASGGWSKLPLSFLEKMLIYVPLLFKTGR